MKTQRINIKKCKKKRKKINFSKAQEKDIQKRMAELYESAQYPLVHV